MTTKSTITLLREHGIQATPQRIMIAEFVLAAKTHPTAEEVWTQIKRKHPTVSRATVYNTLNLLVEKQLLRSQVLTEGTTIFDPKTELHHHFIDEETNEVYDIPWDALRVSGKETLLDFDIREVQVIMRGTKKQS